ncbi:MAG: DNA topoisomerase I [Thermoplasmata archaeon]
MKRLVVAEKNMAAKKIAAILSGGEFRRETLGKVPTYHFEKGGDEWAVMGLKGHIVEWDYPRRLASWSRIDPQELIRAEPIKKTTERGIMSALQVLAYGVEEVIVATDYDREGELIGVEALEIIRQVSPDVPVRRARFSALTAPEVLRAFEEPEELNHSLARSAATRQFVDLAWGATLTRVVSLAADQRWKDYLSIGRVQSPTLALIVAREEEIDAFNPEPFWNIQATLEKEEQTFVGDHGAGRFWDRKEAATAMGRLEGADEATVAQFEVGQRAEKPPAPFNTTSFLGQATQVGLTAYRAMRVAEDLYNKGLISYPRTDNTVYPKSLPLRDILRELEASSLGEDARRVAGKMRRYPTRGKRQSTDHPPIHPVAAATRSSLRGDRWKVYELIVRRFLATLSPDSLLQSKKATLEIRGETFIAKGLRTVKRGWRAVYPYRPLKEVRLPGLAEGEHVKVLQIEMAEGETQPPARYTQGRLIQRMEREGLGTKATRHEAIQKLYNRRYIHGNPIHPTPSGKTLITALRDHVHPITKSEMTALLEEEMERVARGEKELEEVLAESKEMLSEAVHALQEHEEEIGQEIKEALREQRILGTCVECGSNLMIKRSRWGNTFVGCEGYPKCRVTYNLPKGGVVEPSGSVCEVCGVPTVRVTSGRKAAEKCINEGCEVFLAENRIGICPSCGGNLLQRRARGGKRFVGCTGYPDCNVTYPLPQRGLVTPLPEACEVCGSPRVRIFAGRRPWTTCIDFDCPTNERAKARAQVAKGS